MCVSVFLIVGICVRDRVHVLARLEVRLCVPGCGCTCGCESVSVCLCVCGRSGCVGVCVCMRGGCVYAYVPVCVIVCVDVCV